MRKDTKRKNTNYLLARCTSFQGLPNPTTKQMAPDVDKLRILYEGVKMFAKNGFKLSNDDAHIFTIGVFMDATSEGVDYMFCHGMGKLLNGLALFHTAAELGKAGDLVNNGALHHVFTYEKLKYIQSVINTANFNIMVPVIWAPLKALDIEVLDCYLKGGDCKRFHNERGGSFKKIIEAHSAGLNFYAYLYLKSKEAEALQEQIAGVASLN